MSSPPCPRCPDKTVASDLPGAAKRADKASAATDRGFYDSGYICCIHESLSTVVQHILKDSPGIKDDPIIYKQIVDQLNFVKERSRRKQPVGKPRPCVLLSIVYPNQHPLSGADGVSRQPPQICIMGTFGGTPPQGRVYSHFCIPVYPNCGLQHTEDDAPSTPSSDHAHIHACPRDMRNEKQWLIAFLYRSQSAILGTWKRPRSDFKRGRHIAAAHRMSASSATAPQYWLDEETQGWLRLQCRNKLDEWSAKCHANPDFAQACALEHLVSFLMLPYN
ncbi:hypothetical protein TRAPUB_735 [Trametes pubescens]|uniref:Uncharacterized protein n=1 Tax=Trametes pubescens TaxID=154538 RepID=A0A1M2VLG6_TRAPU|nr:hypothetical protein TRAPUB_735 [Trametes pubescens]